MTWILLLIIGVLSIVGIIYVYKQYDDDENIKKAMVIMLAVIIALTTIYMVFDAKTREIALSTGDQSSATLAILLGFTQGGYSPYMKETWGGTGPEQDFDFDGIKNMWDTDADNDFVEDYYEYPTRFNPFQPDVGITKVEGLWVDENTLKIRATPVEDIVGTGSMITLYVNDQIQEQKTFGNPVTFIIDDYQLVSKIDLRVQGMESDYANKANNLYSYSIPYGAMGEFGVWYSNLENTIEGIIRNNPLFYANNAFSLIENLLRQTIANIPLVVWLGVLTAVVVIMFIYIRRKTKGGGGSFFGKFGKKKEYEPGTTKIEVY